MDTARARARGLNSPEAAAPWAACAIPLIAAARRQLRVASPADISPSLQAHLIWLLSGTGINSYQSGMHFPAHTSAEEN